jgi:hypothetical protein
MNSNIIYVMSGPAHMPYLVASLWTLRKAGNDGLVTVHCWPESFGYARRISKDDRLNIEVVEREPAVRRSDGVGGNAQFLDKIQVAMMQQCDVVLYLDADTTIHGDLTPLMKSALDIGFCATQWNDWKTDRGHAHRRVKELRGIDAIPDEYVNMVVNSPYPSVNGGVWATVPSCPVLKTWYDWTLACGKLFISDERVLHLMMSRHAECVSVMTGGKWNCSPLRKFQPKYLKDEDVIVRHYHGDGNVRPNKQKESRGVELWMPIYEECMEENVGGIREWVKDVKNRYLAKLPPTLSQIMCG